MTAFNGYWGATRLPFSVVPSLRQMQFMPVQAGKNRSRRRCAIFAKRLPFEAVSGVKISFGKLLASDQKNIFPTTEIIPKPFLVFDPSGTRKDDWNERGIKKSGPYDQRTFSPK